MKVDSDSVGGTNVSHLIVILKHLCDDSDLGMVVLDGNHPEKTQKEKKRKSSLINICEAVKSDHCICRLLLSSGIITS